MNPSLLFSLIFFALALVGAAGPSYSQEKEAPKKIAIITHPDNGVTALTKSELGRMFQKKRTVWADGERSVPIDQSGSSEIRRRFYKLVLNKTLNEMKRYWMQETMTGNAKPPVSLESSATVKQYIGKLRGGIGYIYEDEIDDSVRAIHVPDLPELYVPPGAKSPAPSRKR